jgi:glycerophosphoryl diester phosphodiesterase
MGALRLAHRGDWRAAPENSLAAFAAALSNPRCDGLEFDVRTSADGVPVVIHDPTLARVQGRDLGVEALIAADLRAAGIPTLADVLAIVPTTAFLDIEFKSPPAAAAGDIIRAARGDDGDRTVVSSFDPEVVRQFAKEGWPWPRWGNAPVVLPEIVELAVQVGCQGLAVEWHAVDASSVETVRAAGLTLTAWTVRESETFDTLEALGVIAMCVEAEALDG